jgi:uncharacterized membrane protein
MLLTLFAYLIWKDARDRDRDPDTDEAWNQIVISALFLIFLWPFILIRLGEQLEQDKHKHVWVVSITCLALLVSAFSGVGGYLLLGIFIALAKGIGYLYYAYKIQLETEKEVEFK